LSAGRTSGRHREMHDHPPQSRSTQ
jgi:hypothetical protein